mmetsp:Transcript_72551/g.162962  ORF Transcript_72551/g.162962 Transcript_72551/m.162962 type:complete len:103 (+) Transcript_72551:3-311(+)
MNEFVDKFQERIRTANNTFEKGGNGAFIDVCHWHCEACLRQDQGAPWLNFEVDGVRQQDAVSKWWESDFKDDARSHTYMERCRYGLHTECNPTCTVLNNTIR